MAVAGALLGIAAGHGLVALGGRLIREEIGMRFSAGYVSTADVWAVPLALAVGLLAGLLPALQAYRLGVLKNLAATS